MCQAHVEKSRAELNAERLTVRPATIAIGPALAYLFVWLAISVVSRSAAIACRETPQAPQARLHVSPDGAYGMKVLPMSPRGKSSTTNLIARGLLFALQPDGREKTLWKREHPNIPARVFIRPGPYKPEVVTFSSEEGILTSQHWLVVYTDRGNIVRDFSLRDLLSLISPSEMASIPRQARARFEEESHAIWFTRADFSFHDSLFVITLLSGRKIIIDPTNGKILDKMP